MEATVSQTLHLTSCIDSDRTSLKLNNSMRFVARFRKKQVYMLNQNHFQPIKASIEHRTAGLKASCASENSSASILESESLLAFEEDLILKNKSEEIEPYLNGRCIYLVGMMGSGKTTIGQVLAQVLGYSFFDSDKLIEQAAGGTAVADIFKFYIVRGFSEITRLRCCGSYHQCVV